MGTCVLFFFLKNVFPRTEGRATGRARLVPENYEPVDAHAVDMFGQGASWRQTSQQSVGDGGEDGGNNTVVVTRH